MPHQTELIKKLQEIFQMTEPALISVFTVF